MLVVLASSFVSLIAGDDKKPLSSEEFLAHVRQPKGRPFWAQMEGTAKFDNNEGKSIDAKMYVAVKFRSKLTEGQVIISTEKPKKAIESYSIVQRYETGKDSTSVVSGPTNPKDSKETILGYMGISPLDLTMSFLYWDFDGNELKKDGDCRVFLLNNPDKKSKDKVAKVYIHQKYFFPLKVEWFEDTKDLSKAYRKMEIDSFKEVGDFVLVDTLYISGPGWNSEIEFNTKKAGFLSNKKEIPADLIRTVKEVKE